MMAYSGYIQLVVYSYTFLVCEFYLVWELFSQILSKTTSDLVKVPLHSL